MRKALATLVVGFFALLAFATYSAQEFRIGRGLAETLGIEGNLTGFVGGFMARSFGYGLGALILLIAGALVAGLILRGRR